MDNLKIDTPLTNPQLKNLKAKPQAYIVTDGAGWHWKFSHRHNVLAISLSDEWENGKVTLGRYPCSDPRMPDSSGMNSAAAVFRGESPAGEKQLKKVALAKSTSVRDFCERYFNEIIQRTRKNPTQLRRYFKKEIYPSFGSKQMKDVTAQKVQRLVFRKRHNGFESAAAQIRNLLKRVFDYAIVCGLVSVNPVHATPMQFITRAWSRTRTLSPKELWTYLELVYHPNIRRQFKLALNRILLTSFGSRNCFKRVGNKWISIWESGSFRQQMSRMKSLTSSTRLGR